MCKRLSERAADDLIAFVRRVHREAYQHERAGDDVGPVWWTLERLSEDAVKLFAKHGLLTPADDPEVARVFMEEEPAEVAHFNSGDAHLKSFNERHGIAGSPSRFRYAGSGTCTDTNPCGKCFICRGSTGLV
jgi:hypothetical protein